MVDHRAGVAALTVVVAATICTTQLTRGAQKQLNAPGFVAYLHLAMMVLMLPLAWLLSKDGKILARASDVRTFLPMWVISNYCLVRALALAPAGLVTCLFGTSPAQVAILSRIFLAERFTLLRLAAVALAFAGVAALAAHSRFQGDARDMLWGTLLALAAVTASAAYKVAFKVRLGEPRTDEVLSLVGTLGLAAAVLGLPVVWLLAFLGVEDHWWSSDRVDWVLVLSSAAVDVVYNTALAWGLAVASPVFIAVGINMGTPANMLLDALLHGFAPSIAQCCGTVLIALSFVILVFGPQEQRRPLLSDS